MKNNRILSKYVSEYFECKSDKADFFGYYNYDTLNFDQTKILAHRISSREKQISKDDVAEVGYYDVPDGVWHEVDETGAYNWDQGSMLQWLPGEGNENKIIFNNVRNGHLTSRIRDVESGAVKDIDWSIYGITPDGKKSIALEMERSYWCRAYHYYSVANPEHDGLVDENDGVFEIDLDNNTRRRIISIQEVVALDADKDFDKMKHWLEHIMISPDGSRFVFLHRFAYPDNIFLYTTRMLIADIDGSNLQVVPGWRNFRWSHFGWNKDNSFAIYAYQTPKMVAQYANMLTPVSAVSQQKKSVKTLSRQVLVKLVKLMPVSIRKKIKGQTSFYQYYCPGDSGIYSLNQTWNQKFFDIDGHESFTNDCRYMLTDSYTDEDGYRRLIVFDSVTKKGKIIARFLEGRQSETEPRVDLHPKLCANNDYVALDTNNTGTPHLMVLRIDWDMLKKDLR